MQLKSDLRSTLDLCIELQKIIGEIGSRYDIVVDSLLKGE